MDFASSRKPNPKGNHCMIPAVLHSGKDKTIGREKRSVVARGWAWGRVLTSKGQDEGILGS